MVMKRLDDMSKAEARVTIAKDVLKWIRTCLFPPCLAYTERKQ
jgi:hypothetical protein